MNWPCAALSNADLSQRTTMHVGGQAQWLLEPSDPEEFQAAWCAARERGFLPRLLGGGANLIIEDGLFEGVVITTERMRRIFRPLPGVHEGPVQLNEAKDEEELMAMSRMAPPEKHLDPRLAAWAGSTLPSLVRSAQELGYSGLEGLVGVPGSVGGGIAMNAGGRIGWTWDVVESIRVMHPDGRLEDLRKEDCQPQYRNGGLAERICMGAVFRLEPTHPMKVREQMKEFLRHKRAVQPVTEWSAGCIYKNPDPELSDGRSAGKLVEDAGAKGLNSGDAVVSELHGNFIVNRGKARATEVFELIERVRRLVFEHSGVELETEVKVWRREGSSEPLSAPGPH